MKRKDGYMLRSFGDTYIVVAVGDDAESFNKLITLNGVGAFIYNQLSDEKSFEEIVGAMLDEYDVSEELARKDAETFVNDLRAAGLLDG